MRKHITVWSVFFALIAGVMLNAKQDLPTGGSPTVTIEDISQAEDVYFQKNGKYVEVRKDGTTNDSRTALEQLGIDVPYEIHSTVTDGTKYSYWIVVPSPTTTFKYGYGVDAQKMTFLPPPKQFEAATTTP